MDQRIFGLGLSLEAVSLYLLLDALAGPGASLAREAIATRWNASPGQLTAALAELVGTGIVAARADACYALRPADDWRARV